VTKNKKQCEELCPGIFQVSTKQDAVHKKGRRTTFIGNTKRTIAGNQH